MKDSVVFQPQKESLSQVESFVYGICDDAHLDKYLATISVSVMRAVEVSISSACPDSSAPISLSFDFYPRGVLFSIESPAPCFHLVDDKVMPSAGSTDESLFLIQMLADKVTVGNDGCTLDLEFEVRGVNSQEASRRASLMVHQKEEVLTDN